MGDGSGRKAARAALTGAMTLNVGPVASGMPGAARLDPALDDALGRAVDWLLARQRDDGHWVFELEADATIPAEYILLQHYFGTVEPEL